MFLNTSRYLQSFRNFLCNHRASVITDQQVDFVPGRINAVEEPLCVNNPAGSGDSDNNLQLYKPAEKTAFCQENLNPSSFDRITTCRRCEKRESLGAPIRRHL